MTESAFQHDLAELLNQHSMENDSNTPDFILAQYLVRCLDTFNAAIGTRDGWYGVHLSPGEKSITVTAIR